MAQICPRGEGLFGVPFVVFEDDAQPGERFTSVLERVAQVLPSDADVLYLAHEQAAKWRREVSPDLVEAEYVWTTAAYIVWPKGARILLDNLPVNQPVDNYMASLCAIGKLKSYLDNQNAYFLQLFRHSRTSDQKVLEYSGAVKKRAPP